PATHLPLLVRIELRESEDEAADRRRLSELVRLLNAAPGEDETRLILRTPRDDVELELPAINLTEGLEARLKGVLHDFGSITTLARAVPRSDLGAA
ncbi:MAG TPA: hypothetical protein VIU62_05065, partial [Chloroflexota bacterium]